MRRNYWKNKKVLITGHTGFKGSWLSLILDQMGAKVYGISLKEKKKSLFNYLNLKKIFKKNIYCNIGNRNLVKKNLYKINPEVIFHLAAQPLVIESFINPLKTLNANIIGTGNLLNASRRCSRLKVIVIITSDKCYDSNIQRSYKENDKLGGNDVYSASKACAEIISAAYKESFLKKKGIKLATARSGNVIGGGDFSPNRLIPDLIKAYKNNNNCTIRNKESTRPWQHVLDPINGYIKLAEMLAVSKNKIYESAWNFGPNNKSKKVIDVVKTVQTIIPIKIKYLTNNPESFRETKKLSLNSDKARKFLKWKNRINFYDTIKLTIEWHLNQSNKKKLMQITKKQISRIIN